MSRKTILEPYKAIDLTNFDNTVGTVFTAPISVKNLDYIQFDLFCDSAAFGTVTIRVFSANQLKDGSFTQWQELDMGVTIVIDPAVDPDAMIEIDATKLNSIMLSMTPNNVVIYDTFYTYVSGKVVGA